MTNIIKPKSAYLLSRLSYERIYGPGEREDIANLTDVCHPALSGENWMHCPDLCREVEILFSGWGMPSMDSAFLDAFPKLRAVFYGAGTIKEIVTEAFWDRNILITTASEANAIPVCEFTLAAITLSLKHFWRLSSAIATRKSYPQFLERESPGMYNSTVALISLGSIGRMVAAGLQNTDVRVIAYDPVVDPLVASSLGVELCSLEEVFCQGDVISCHAPSLKETEGLLTAEHFLSMKSNATFINTSRGIVVDEQGLIEALTRRTDLHAILDLTHPEPPLPGSPLYSMSNVRLTPHIAGSKGQECQRLGRTMVHELQRYLRGEPLKYGIRREELLMKA